jgi:predicted PolB exonuclease-like 3'-5' exonuclease
MDLSQDVGMEGKLEKKEYLDRETFTEMVRNFLTALENDKDLQVEVKGENYQVPRSAFENGKFRSEYEVKKGEYEYELTLKWRDDEKVSNQ